VAQWTGRRVWSGWGARWFLRRVRRRRRRRRRRSTGVVVVVVDAAVARPTVAVLHSWTSVVRRRPSSSRVVISVECQSFSSVCFVVLFAIFPALGRGFWPIRTDLFRSPTVVSPATVSGLHALTDF